MIGLKRGTVMLMPHQKEWTRNAERTIHTLKRLLEPVAVDIQHIGSTAIPSIYAKPIIDLVVGVRILDDIVSYAELLKQHDIVFRGEDVAGQLLFVMGDFEKDTRTHHIHAVRWNGTDWNNYINFRDYLNHFSDKAMEYDTCKKKLTTQFADDRGSYTKGKKELIDRLLNEAHMWKAGISCCGQNLEMEK
ncbi:MAG: GrpB family protein [Oscillospiraceae bacterium]